MHYVIIGLLFITSSAAAASVETFSPTDIVNWESQLFSGSSTYTIATTNSDEQPYLRGSCKTGDASGLFIEQEMAITNTTELRWQWRIPATLPANKHEKTKGGDDFSARIYIIVKRGLFDLSSRAINYVWSSEHNIGEHWANPFTSSAHMVVVSDKKTPVGEWESISRNIQQDFRRFHGIDVTEIDSLAVMVDCDNHGAQREFHLDTIRLDLPVGVGSQ